MAFLVLLLYYENDAVSLSLKCHNQYTRQSNVEMAMEQDRWQELVEVRLVVLIVSNHLAIERRTTIRD